MEDNLIKILAEFDKLKGQFVLTDSWKVERLIAIGDDEQDYYYITFDGRNINWQSCVGRIMPLKGQLRDQDYDYLIYIAKLNHYDQVNLSAEGNMDMFLKAVEDEISKYPKTDKFLTELCWELN